MAKCIERRGLIKLKCSLNSNKRKEKTNKQNKLRLNFKFIYVNQKQCTPVALNELFFEDECVLKTGLGIKMNFVLFLFCFILYNMSIEHKENNRLIQRI